MAEYLLLLISVTTVINTFILLKMWKKEAPTGMDNSLYDEQIKNLKRIIRLNEKYIKDIKNKEVKNDEKMAETKQQEDMVQTDRRVY